MSWEPLRARFDEIIHSPTRLRICAALDTAVSLEFSALEESLGISTSLLSHQLKILTDVGYVRLEKRRQTVGRPRTWVALTPLGRRAFLGHILELRSITAASLTPSIEIPDTEVPVHKER